MIKLTSISNHIRYNNLSIIITIKFHQLMLRCNCLVKFSLSRRDDDSNRFLPSRGIIPNTNPYFPHRGRIGSPLVQFRNQLRGSDQRCTLRDSTNLPRRSGLEPALGLTPLAPHTSFLPPVCALSLTRALPELSYSASRSKRLIRPTKC